MKLKMEEGSFDLVIKHITRYSFSQPVFLESHFLYFRPDSAAHITLLDHRIEVTPNPDGVSKLSWCEGQEGLHCWFSGTHTQLLISAESRVRVSPHNPFGFLIYPTTYTRFPFSYPEELKPLLGLALFPEEAIDNQLQKYLAVITARSDAAQENQKDTTSLLWECNQAIHQDFILEERLFGPPQGVAKTYADQRGSCRDLAHLEITLLRHLGVAARFVSGYLFFEGEGNFELHAWVEAFLPGAGWIGLDPSHGVFTDHQYIPVTRSVRHAQTMPVIGTFRGNARSRLSSELKIEKQ